MNMKEARSKKQEVRKPERFLILLLTSYLLLLFSGCAVFSLIGKPPKFYQESHFVKTADDWTLSLNRFYLKGGVKYKNPIILCHGMGYNSHFWDINARRSFARYLSERGFDVWVVSLRGAGESTKSGWLSFRDILSMREEDLANVSLAMDKLDWSIDDHIFEDVPSVIEKVREVTGASQVDWIGHSMGVMIILAYLERASNPEQVRNIVAIAPSCIQSKPLNAPLSFIEKRKWIFDLGLVVNQKNLYKFLVPFHGGVRDPLASLFYEKRNMNRKTISDLYNHVVENISPGVLNQFIMMLQKGDFLSSDGKINYSKGLAKIQNPILFVAGRDDNLARTENVRYGYRKVSSRDKAYLEISTLHGAKQDYGHDDLILGKRAHQEVYPKIYNWLVSKAQIK